MRVIAGTHRGRRLHAPRGEGTRPTPDRVREALFSILGPVDGRSVLDLYSGTGAIAIEALSRGAERAVLVERNRGALGCIERNLAELELGPERAQVLPMDVRTALRVLAARGDRFDAVYLDPPYADVEGVVPDLLFDLPPLLARDATVIVEHSTSTSLEAERPRSPTSPPGARLEWTRSRTYGETTLSFFAL